MPRARKSRSIIRGKCGQVLCLFFCVGYALMLLSCSSQNQDKRGGEANSTPSVESDAAGSKGIASESSQPQASTRNSTLPVVTSAKFAYIPTDAGSFMNIEVEGKADEGKQLSFFYEWTKNGEPAGNSKQLKATLKRGDKISVKITPFDGREYGRSVRLDREISNMFPVITEQKEIIFDQKVLKYHVKAYDPDGDTLQYAIKSGPAGMSIDSLSGLLQWDVPSDFHGVVPVTVSVNDGHGGETVYTFRFTIGSENE